MSLLCTICEQSLASAAILETPCNGRFHEQCLRDWCKTELTCPACCGEQENCRKSCENMEMNEFPKVCSKVLMPSIAEDELGAQLVTPAPPENAKQLKIAEELCGEFAEMATSHQAVAERFERLQQRFAEVLGLVKNNL